MNDKAPEFWIEKTMDNPYWDNICAMAEKQRAKGMATYGKGLEVNQAEIMTRLEYLQEELIDALMYCEWIKESIKTRRYYNEP